VASVLGPDDGDRQRPAREHEAGEGVELGAADAGEQIGADHHRVGGAVERGAIGQHRIAGRGIEARRAHGERRRRRPARRGPRRREQERERHVADHAAEPRRLAHVDEQRAAGLEGAQRRLGDRRALSVAFEHAHADLAEEDDVDRDAHVDRRARARAVRRGGVEGALVAELPRDDLDVAAERLGPVVLDANDDLVPSPGDRARRTEHRHGLDGDVGRRGRRRLRARGRGGGNQDGRERDPGERAALHRAIACCTASGRVATASIRPATT
jgi:hypothetical protein